MNDYKFVAPDIDRLLRFFDKSFMNASVPSEELCRAMDPLFEALKDLKHIRRNDEVKQIWILVPRGTIEDYGSYEDMLDLGEIGDWEEFERNWEEDYPDPFLWYSLSISEYYDRSGVLQHRGVGFGNKLIISAWLGDERHADEEPDVFREEAAITICSLILAAVQDSMESIREGTYNERLMHDLPFQFRTGVIKRSVLWERKPEWKEFDMEGISEEMLDAFRKLVESGSNDTSSIGRMKTLTANDFFKACAIGYEACGYDGRDLPLVDQYFKHADGRDEGLSGRGHGLNEGPGIDLDDPDAWDKWYFDDKRGGGHPWEVVRGGNSTHVDLYVRHDKSHLDFRYRIGELPEAEYRNRLCEAGYYFNVAGKYRAAEAVSFYTAIHQAGLPVLLSDADVIIDRYKGDGYVGIVPHHIIPKYCEGMFPSKYGRVVDFMHVYQEDLELITDAIEWIPEEEAELTTL